MSSRSALSRWPAASVVPMLVLLVAGLGAASACRAPEHSEVLRGTDYTVRGLVQDTSGLSGDPQRLRIHHEAVTDLLDVEGNPDPMRAMVMNLTVMPGAALPEGLGPQDKIEFVLNVAWDRSPVALVKDVRMLDPGTTLVLE